LPFLTALCPSERYHQQRGQSHKTLPEWARQMTPLHHGGQGKTAALE